MSLGITLIVVSVLFVSAPASASIAWDIQCDAAEVFYSVPLHTPLTWTQYSFTRPVPEINRYYRFRVLMKWPDGTVQDIGIPGAPSWNVASCGEAVAARGYLANANENGDVELLPCPGSCDTWPCNTFVNLS